MSRFRLPSILLGLPALLILMTVGLLGCVGDDPLDPEDLAPGELMVAATLPGSGELDLGRSLGLRLAAGAAGWDTLGVEAQAAARIEPDIAGHWRWNDRGHLEFHPDNPYEPNTRYRVTMQPEAFSARGLNLRGRLNFDFTAAPFVLVSMDLQRERVGWQPVRHRVAGRLEFSYPVDPATVLEHLRAELEGVGPVDLVMETTFTTKELRFRTEVFDGDRRDRLLVVHLEESLIPALGGSSLARAAEASVQVPALERLQITDLAVVADGLEPALRLRFNDTVLPEDMRRHLTIEPEVPDLRVTTSGRRVDLSGGFQVRTSYKLAIDGGLAAESGLTMERDFQRTVGIGDLEPQLRISGPGNYLSLRGEGKVGVETVNLEKFHLEVQRIYPNNLVPFLQKVRLRAHRDYYYGWDLQDAGALLYEQDFTVSAGPTNSRQLTAVDLEQALAGDSRGVFRLLVRNPDQRWQSDGRWLVATDLGLVAKRTEDRVEVAVASISKLAPVAGVQVRVLSQNNQLLARGRTDSQGLVAFEGLSGSEEGSRPFVVVATQDDDLSFLAFDETGIPTADLDVGGVALPEKGYRAFLYGDRDIYRPGETLELVWMVRDARLQPATGFPLNLKIVGPGGEEFVSVRTEVDEAGCGEYSAEIPRWLRTGPYTAMLLLGENQVLGETRISIEEFMPDRMKVSAELRTAAPPAVVVGRGDTLRLAGRAMSLFGPPAADRKAEAQVWFKRTPVVLPGYEDFRFGEDLGDELPPRRHLGALQTDAEGHVAWKVPLPEAPGYQGWLRMTALISVFELGGGRAVSATTEIDYSPVDRVIGLRNLDGEGSDYREAGRPVRFEGVMLDLQGRAQADPGARLKLMRRQWRTVLRRLSDGNHRYVSEYDEKLQQERSVALGAGATELTITPESHGSYRLVLESGDGQVRGSIDFYVYGFGYSPWAMSNPEKVNLKLDRDSYGAGELVTASVEAPFPGLMLLTLEREKVYQRQWVRLEENTGTVQVRLPRGAEPNLYLTATLLRSLDELDPRTPARAFGAEPVFVDRSARTLPVQVATVEEMRPRAPLKVRVKLPEDADPLRLTVAAVDEGILQLTDYGTPSALEHFLARRRLGVQSHDIWSLLLPEFGRVKRSSAAGGGEPGAMSAAPEMARRLNPLAADRVKPVALWSGLLEGRPGWQDILLDVPEFNGSLRVMVVATAGDRFGSAEARVRVADPLVLSPSLPRFLAPGDRFRVPVPVYNGLSGTTDPSTDVTVNVQPTGPVAVVPETPASRVLPVTVGQEEVAWFDLQALEEVGLARIQMQATAAGEQVSVGTELPVRPPRPLESRITTGSLRGAVAEVTLGSQWLPGTSSTTISVAANPAAAYGAALPYLLSYPYGCLEQRTSRCFPLIHFGPLAATLAPGQFGDRDGDYFVNSGLDYLATLHRPGLGFPTWPGAGHDSFHPFANVYATHFLVEAQKAGYVVPDDLLESMLAVVARLSRTGRDGWPEEWTDRHRRNTRAYACWVLALADRPERGAMDQLVQDDWKLLSVAARTHLAGAFALAGNRARFDQLLPAADAPVQDGRSSGFTWYSLARDEAMRLEVLATVDPDHVQVPRLMERLGARAENGRWYNTQENAFALLALGKLAAADRLAPATGRVLIDGRQVGAFTEENFSLQGEDWAGRTVTIETTGGGMAWYSVLEEGIPRGGDFLSQDNGLAVRREYLDLDGSPVDLQSLEQGQIVVCRLMLQSDKGRVRDLVLSDLVPAGLEIENPRLSRDGGHDWIHEEDLRRYKRLPVDHLEIRDDRLLLFTSVDTQTAVFHYTLRAVTAGTFTLPPVRAEAMYDPEVMSTRGAGEIRIVAPR